MDRKKTKDSNVFANFFGRKHEKAIFRVQSNPPVNPSRFPRAPSPPQFTISSRPTRTKTSQPFQQQLQQQVQFLHSVHQQQSFQIPLSERAGDLCALEGPTLPFPKSEAFRDQNILYSRLAGLEFRLLRILLAERPLIKCELVRTKFQDHIPYVAISYAWGDAGDTQEIELNGTSVSISVSLYGALKALQQENESVLVWADALCINQKDRDERTEQVELMASIYSNAESVAIWLGPDADDSSLAINLLDVISNETNAQAVSQLISFMAGKHDLDAIVSLFERDYWNRVWVVQEIFNARSITVYCGCTKLPWVVYQLASLKFRQHQKDLDVKTASLNQFNYSQILVYQGPGSLPDLNSYKELGERALLELLRAYRRKLTSDARDKLFGILGALPENIRQELRRQGLRADYSLSVKDVYTRIVNYFLQTTGYLDIICDALHFPIHMGSVNLPSYVPDWSQNPQIAALGHKYSFSAANQMKANCKFLDKRQTKLEILAIHIDVVSIHGVAVDTHCTLGDYLMAFLHWRALLLGSIDQVKGEDSLQLQKAFCTALCLGQNPDSMVSFETHEFPTAMLDITSNDQWPLTACYHVFASLLRERLPHLVLDQDLLRYIDAKIDFKHSSPRQFLQKNFGDRMMGCCFCRTQKGLIGMGTGFMVPGDIVVVPLGCNTPILLRSEGISGEYRFVGDIYIDGYMFGKAVNEWNTGQRALTKYILH